MGTTTDLDTKEVTEQQQEHSEYGGHDKSHLAAHVTYDNEGIGGIIRSPYVFGAALLASFGGFSFGYGKL